MNGKKESLFKQKLKQAKLDQQQSKSEKLSNQIKPQQIQSFPKVFKLDSYDKNVNNNQENKNLREKNNNDQTNTSEIEIFDQRQKTSEIEQMPYLLEHKEGLHSVLSDDELNQINNENWNAVNSMNQEERMNYVNLIQNTLPKHFIEKLRKKGTKPQQNLNLDQPSSNLKSTMIPETNNLPLYNQPEVQNSSITHKNRQQGKSQTKTPIQEQQTQDQTQNHKAIIDNIHLNIKTGKLYYLHENMFMTFSEDQKISFVNKTKIYEMLKTQNNQSQIIGAQLVLSFVKGIFPTEDRVVFVDKIPLHGRIILWEIYKLLKVIESDLKSTKFYSCYIEMLVKSVEILTCIHKSLTDSMLSEQLTFLQSQFQKSQKSLKQLINKSQNSSSISSLQQSQQNDQKQQKQMLFESLGIMYHSLKEEKALRQQKVKSNPESLQIEERFQKIKSNNRIDDLIEAILIEQTLKKEEFDEYEITPAINDFLQTVNDFWLAKVQETLEGLSENLNEASEFYCIFYRLICKLNKKKKVFLFYSSTIQKIYSEILSIIQVSHIKSVLQVLLSKKFSEKLNQKKHKTSLQQVKCSIVFMVLFIYRQLSVNTDKLATFLQGSKLNESLSEEQTSIVVYINFSHYLQAQDLKGQEIQILEKMLSWLTIVMKNRKTKNQEKCFLDSYETLTSLLGLFLSFQQEVYSLIDQNLLHDVFKEAVQYFQAENDKNNGLDKPQILTETQIKQMIQNYNYNSFGNDIFTKIVFWVAVSINSEFQALIAEEVMMRYPMLFYYASEPSNKQGQQTKEPQNVQNPNQTSSPLLGNIEQYIKVSPTQKLFTFAYKSNQQAKANLLKLLFMNLDFSCIKQIPSNQLQKVLGTQSINQTQGFTLNKIPLNQKNYFYRYLIEPFLKQNQYKELF